jgi:adenylylsulfate kinase-like enzyme
VVRNVDYTNFIGAVVLGNPESPEIHLDTTAVTAEQAAERIVAHLERNGVLRRG